jgi:ribosomal protein S12 methylthiotransferase accessory factor
MPEPSIDPLIDSQAGLISRMSIVEMDPSDPSVFLVNAKLADLTTYGLPCGAGGHGGAGAGLTLDAATMAAVGEAVERYSLALVPTEAICATVGELQRRGIPVCAADEWALFDESQYSSVPFQRFNSDTPVAWIRAHELTADVESYVPCCLTHMPYVPLFPDEKVIGYSISTGAATGRTAVEATLRGIMEVIERDAFMIVWRNRLSCPSITIDEHSPLHEVMKKRFSRPGLRYSLFLTSLDLPFHSVFGILHDNSGPVPRMTVGGACHFDPAEAVRKTCLELVQGMKWLEYMDEDQFTVVPRFSNVRQFEDRIRLYGFNDLHDTFDFLGKQDESVALSDLHDFFRPSDNEDALKRTCALLQGAGLHVYARDVTPVDVRACGLTVVKILIPQAVQMEGDFSLELLGGKRWQEVPVRLGCRSRQTELEERNPFPHPYP